VRSHATFCADVKVLVKFAEASADRKFTISPYLPQALLEANSSVLEDFGVPDDFVSSQIFNPLKLRPAGLRSRKYILNSRKALSRQNLAFVPVLKGKVVAHSTYQTYHASLVSLDRELSERYEIEQAQISEFSRLLYLFESSFYRRLSHFGVAVDLRANFANNGYLVLC